MVQRNDHGGPLEMRDFPAPRFKHNMPMFENFKMAIECGQSLIMLIWLCFNHQ